VSLILLLFISALLNAQFYEYGQDAGDLKWYQFSTSNYKVIYPKGMDSLARAFASRLEYFYPYLGKPLDHHHSHMPVVLHNESSFSNGVFVWAPKRVEIFTNPDPNGYHQDWLTQLALHEGRHAFQIDKMDQGITKALSYLGGEQAAGAMAVFLPYWYLEGDAVDAETRLSNTGRGRQPSFEMELKAQLLEKDRIYSFSKAAVGSFNDYVPNHYKLGYAMVRYGRRNYGDQFWVDFQQYAARKPYLLNPTHFSMKTYGIRSKKQFYKDALDAYKKHWTQQASGRELTPSEKWNHRESRHYTSYTFPYHISDSLLFAYKTGLDQIPEFVFLEESGKEQRIFQPGALNSGRISFSGTHVIWDEFVPDTRWSNRNYSIIRTYEMATEKVVNLGTHTRYYSPDVSHDGSRIAVIEQSEKQEFRLILLEMDGSVIESVPSPGNKFIQHPTWMETDSALVMVKSGASGKSLYYYSLEQRRWEELFDAGFDNISYPEVRDHKIYFGGTFSGIDNVYCHDLSDGETFQVTSARFGAFYPQVSSDGRKLLYSDYSAQGYKVAMMPMEEGLWDPLEEVRDHSEQIDYEQTEDERTITSENLFADSTTVNTKRYHKALHLFNFHSWLPLYFNYLNPNLYLNPEHLPVSPGFSLVSQNHLSTAVSQLGYEYKEGYHMFHSGIKLKGRFPIVNLFFNYGGEPNVLLLDEGDSLTTLPQNLTFSAQVYTPLRLNTGKILSLIQPRIDYTYRRDIQYVESNDTYSTGAHYLYYYIYSTAYLRMGKKDILPRAGATFAAGYYHAPFNHQIYGSAARAGITAYLPGFLKHQTIKLSAYHQKQYPLDLGRPAFINLISLPRGLHGIFGEEMTKYSADYVLPLLYPDLELSGLLYLKRIRGAVWADHMKGNNVIIAEPEPHYENKNYTTYGVDLIADIHLMRISFPLSVGGRIYYEPETRNMGFEAIYSIDID